MAKGVFAEDRHATRPLKAHISKTLFRMAASPWQRVDTSASSSQPTPAKCGVVDAVVVAVVVAVVCRDVVGVDVSVDVALVLGVDVRVVVAVVVVVDVGVVVGVVTSQFWNPPARKALVIAPMVSAVRRQSVAS